MGAIEDAAIENGDDDFVSLVVGDVDRQKDAERALYTSTASGAA